MMRTEKFLMALPLVALALIAALGLAGCGSPEVCGGGASPGRPRR